MGSKRIIALLGVLAFSVNLITGCGKVADSTSAEESKTVAESTEDATDEKSEETVVNVTDENKDGEITIGYSLKTVQEERWQRELDGCQRAADELGVNFVYQVANGDAQMQISQIENLITQGVDVIMVTAVDAGALSNVLQEAKDDGIKILIYDQQLENTYGDVFVGYSDYANGTLIAQILKDKNVSGKVVMLHGDKSSGIESIIEGESSVLEGLDVEIVMQQYCTNWGAEAALGYAQNALAEQNNDIAAFVCMNDGIASGAIQALEEVGMAGKVVVTGMDCELTAVQRIVAGTQTSTLYKDSDALSKAAIETAVSLAKGEEIKSENTINFGVNDMPHVVVNSAIITADNIQTELIDKGIYTEEEVYGAQ